MLELKRVPDWRVRLGEMLASVEDKPFRWGADCALGFGGPVVEALTGVDIVPAVAPYTTRAEAQARLQEQGVSSLSEWLAARFPEVHASKARVGDLAIIPGEEIGEGVGVYIGERIAVLGMRGYGTIARSPTYRSFKVA